jgi:HEPN domain-containing protein
MPRRDVSLLERAKTDLWMAEFALTNASDETQIDAAAYHCQQCIEKAVKYVITLRGIIPSNSNYTDDYLEDLEEGELKEKVKSIGIYIDRWNEQILYSKTILSNRNSVGEVLAICKEIITAAEKEAPCAAQCAHKF